MGDLLGWVAVIVILRFKLKWWAAMHRRLPSIQVARRAAWLLAGIALLWLVALAAEEMSEAPTWRGALIWIYTVVVEVLVVLPLFVPSLIPLVLLRFGRWGMRAAGAISLLAAVFPAGMYVVALMLGMIVALPQTWWLFGFLAFWCITSLVLARAAFRAASE
jgi:hypothetical protein